MIIRSVIFITLLVIVSVNDGFCEIYKWRSDDGSISFTDDLGKVPEKYRDQVEVKEFKSDESETIERETITEDPDILDENSGDEQKELTEEEKREIDEDIRGVWDGMKESLMQRKIN